MSYNKNILLIEDEPKIAQVVESFLNAKGYSTVSCDNGKKGMTLFAEGNFALVLLDLMLPDMSGEDVCQKLRACSEVPIIMVTAKVQEEDLLRGLKIGADDYLKKPFSLKELLARVEALLRRSEMRKLVGETTAATVPISDYDDGRLAIDCEGFAVTLAGEPIALTPYEFRILASLARRPRKVFTREELIELALGADYDGFERTIDSHIKNLRRKIETDSKNPHYVKTVRGVGYTFGGWSDE